jgi:hypothetical protein
VIFSFSSKASSDPFDSRPRFCDEKRAPRTHWELPAIERIFQAELRPLGERYIVLDVSGDGLVKERGELRENAVPAALVPPPDQIAFSSFSDTSCVC